MKDVEQLFTYQPLSSLFLSHSVCDEMDIWSASCWSRCIFCSKWTSFVEELHSLFSAVLESGHLVKSIYVKFSKFSVEFLKWNKQEINHVILMTHNTGKVKKKFSTQCKSFLICSWMTAILKYQYFDISLLPVYHVQLNQS